LPDLIKGSSQLTTILLDVQSKRKYLSSFDADDFDRNQDYIKSFTKVCNYEICNWFRKRLEHSLVSRSYVIPDSESGTKKVIEEGISYYKKLGQRRADVLEMYLHVLLTRSSLTANSQEKSILSKIIAVTIQMLAKNNKASIFSLSKKKRRNRIILGVLVKALPSVGIEMPHVSYLEKESASVLDSLAARRIVSSGKSTQLEKIVLLWLNWLNEDEQTSVKHELRSLIDKDVWNRLCPGVRWVRMHY
jgi:hypothetical protein